MASREPWTNVRLRAAWAREDWNAVIREYRRAAGLSQLDMGSLIGMPQSHVSRIESGLRKITSAYVVSRLAEGLNVPDELRGLSARREPLDRWNPGPELRDRIAHAHTTGRTDIRSAKWIARVLTEQRRAEDEIGGQDLWMVVRSQLDTVTSLLPTTSGKTADTLLILAAEHAHWLSWVAAEEGQRGAALSWLDLAQGWAVDAGSSDMLCWVTRVRSYYALSNGDPIRALRTAEMTEVVTGAVSPSSVSASTQATALAAAALGERDRSKRLADEAYELAMRTPSAEDRPNWLYWLDPVRAKLNRAEAAHAVKDWQTCVDLFSEALGDLDGYPRDHAYYSARLEDARRRV